MTTCLRAGNAQLTEAYVNLRNGEAWLVGAHFAPLKTTSTHLKADPTRARKLLLHRYELDRLTGAVERKGYALVPLYDVFCEITGFGGRTNDEAVAVTVDAEADLQAHAWVRVGAEVLTGARERHDFTVVATFARPQTTSGLEARPSASEDLQRQDATR